MKHKEMMQWAFAVLLVSAAVAIVKWGPSMPNAEAAEGAQSMTAVTECQ